jgi:hypothetical protein
MQNMFGKVDSIECIPVSGSEVPIGCSGGSAKLGLDRRSCLISRVDATQVP